MKFMGVLVAIVTVAFFIHSGTATQPSNTTLSKREVIKLQNDTWSSLDQGTRKAIAERSKYVYRISDDLIIDAYDLMYWRERLNALLVRTKIQKYTNHVGYRTKETVGYNWEYHEDPEFDAYFSLPTYGVFYWYCGALINDRALWSSPEYKPLRKIAGVANATTKAETQQMEEWLQTSMPLFIVVDPIAQLNPSIEVYRENSGSIYLNRGGVGSALGKQLAVYTPKDGKIALFPGDFSFADRRGAAKLPVVRGRQVRDGIPDIALDFYLLMPDISAVSGTALGPASRNMQSTLAYQIEMPDKHQLSAKELAVAWVNGELEIPYRTVQKQDGNWICNETLLQRP